MNIVLADSIGPDECRLWDIDNYQPGKLQDSYDKQILRDWLMINQDFIKKSNLIRSLQKNG